MRRLKSRWFCFTDDEIGPFTLAEVVKKFSDGDLQTGDLVRRESDANWRRIETVAEIHQALSRRELRNRPLSARLTKASVRLMQRCLYTCGSIALQLAIWSLILNVIGRLFTSLLWLFR